MTKTKEERVNILTNQMYWIISKTALLIYYLAFIWISYFMFLECRNSRDFWIVPDILNGIMGGFFFVYPFNIFRYGLETLDGWLKWFVIMASLTVIAIIIGGVFGLGGMK